MSSPPGPTDIHWNVLGKDGGAAQCLGEHYAFPYYGGSRYPQVRLTSRARVRNVGDTAGFLFAVTPGRSALTASTPTDSRVVMATTFADLDFTISLQPLLLPTSPTAACRAGAPGTPSPAFSMFTLWVGAYVTPGGSADWLGLCAYLVPP